MADFPVFDINPTMFEKPTLQEGGFGGVLSDAIAKRLARAQAQKEETAAKYAERKTLADILKTELENQYYGPNIESEINQRKANIPYLQAQTQKIQLENPWISREKAAEIAYKNAATRKSQMDIEEALRQREIDKQIQKAFSGQGAPGIVPGVTHNAPVSSPAPIAGPPSAHPSVQQQPNTEAMQEKVISQGAPQLTGIDYLYDSNPVLKQALEKKGFKKVQQVKIDKTGKTTVVTRYPSGKITVQTEGGIGDEGIPLTTPMITQHQNVVSSVDVAIPVLDKIIKMDDSDYSRFGGWSNKGAKYKATVKQGLDSVLGAFGLPKTNEGIQSILDQLEIGHNESPTEYRKRIEELKKDLLARQKYSAGLVKKAVKITGSENENDPYNLGDYDVSGE